MKKLPVIIAMLTFGLLLFVGGLYVALNFGCPICPEIQNVEDEKRTKPKAMMLLIEFKNTDGLVNMVSDMKERNIEGILMVNGDFVEQNKEVIKEILKSGVIEIAASYDPKPYWDMTYDEQYETITDMLTKIEGALGVDIRIISSRYMASDENTVKIADELGIEYITARGTTELATTVYKPEEYDVKIISVSNIDVPEFKYGSFCDYSFYERNGSPEDMEKEYKRAIEEEKFIGVSHTYIGGYKSRWNEMWHNFWDNYEVEWVDLDTLGTVDKVMPMWQIPINKNAPYTPEKIRPAIPYEEEENVINPCLVENLNPDNSLNDNTAPTPTTKPYTTPVPTNTTSSDFKNQEELVILHNNTGPMCLEALEFFKANNIAYKEHLNTDSNFSETLYSYKLKYPTSSGFSTSYEYYPIIIAGNKSYSGFNDNIKSEILSLYN